MNQTESNSYGVLIAEDSVSDRFLIKSAIGATTRLRLLAEVSDGVQVLAYLQGEGQFADRKKFPLPHLLMLDLKMPRLDGFQVLQWLRTRSFKDLTTVVLTDSIRTEHLKEAMDLGADFFQVKPRSNHELEAIIRGLEKYLSETTAIATYATTRRSPAKRLKAETAREVAGA